ncbi:RNA polymerase II-associated [Thelephora terrestris]|uniref:RNA polymerase II-associated n=1 Tax=Thelephora terrestris TaxID=56493 RepID=A0A9P6L688_9AGAM|nr:RNA polymerase II-associated [Thelephora terrestris]
MASKKSKIDLLVRVRYSNPLPAPPCPPKLLDIPTNPMRYARPEFLETLANDTPLPMIVDAECGMPLDLGLWECLWTDDGDDSALNPDPKNLPKLDPKDQFLLGDSTGSSLFVSTSAPGSSTPHAVPTVTWLRKTEYITSREGNTRPSSSQDQKNLAETSVDISRSAQIRDIEASFEACATTFDLSSLKHPNKPNITAVSSYEIFPNVEIWANTYDLFKFSERPGERPPDVEDPRLDCAIMRPMESDGDHFLSYYLTQKDEDVVQFKQNRVEHMQQSLAENFDDDEVEKPVTPFLFVRDYETVKVEQEVPNEFLLLFDDDSQPPTANYKNIERKIILKKKRVNPQETYDKWDVINVTHVGMNKEEVAEALAEVKDPMYFLGRAELDAEGEVVDDTQMELMETTVPIIA